jgi:hypothetical protein
MSFYKRYSIIIGGLALLLVIIVLVSVPSDILSQQATFIGTELQHATENETRVLTKMNLGDAEHMKDFPKRFGNWMGLDFGSSDQLVNLGADIILLRIYLNTAYYQPIHLAIVQSREPSSFHPPPICYKASGWEIEEEGTVEVPVPDLNWASASEPIYISAKKLVALKRGNEEVVDREVALYYYVKGNLFEDTVTMVQVTATAPMEGSYDIELGELKGFMGETVPLIFEPGDQQEGEMLAIHLSKSGAGIAIMAACLLIAVGLMIYPKVTRP